MREVKEGVEEEGAKTAWKKRDKRTHSIKDFVST